MLSLGIMNDLKAQQNTIISFSGKLGIGACLSKIELTEKPSAWQQNLGTALTLEGYFKYRRKELFSVALGGGINFFQFSYTSQTARYGIALWGPKTELILHGYLPGKNKNYVFGSAFGFSFHSNEQRISNEFGFVAKAESFKSNLFFFTPQFGFVNHAEKISTSILFQFNCYPSGMIFLRNEISTAVDTTNTSYRGNYIGISLIFDFHFKTKEKIKPVEPDHPIIPVPPEFAQRNSNFVNDIRVRRKKITVWVYDHGTIDNDSISLQLNNEIVLSNYALVREKKKVKLKLEKGENQLVLLAHNEGSNPPNSCAVIIRSGLRKQKLILNSSLKDNEGIRLRWE